MYHGPCAGMIPWFESLGYSFTKGGSLLLTSTGSKELLTSTGSKET